MKILNTKIDWKLGWGNSPELIVEVDQFPEREDYLFEKTELREGNFYLGYHEKSETYRFLFHTPENETGFYGENFSVKMKDGTTEKFKGPWASRASIASKFSPEPIVEVLLTQEGNRFSREVSMTISRVRSILPEGSFLIPKQRENEVTYVISNDSNIESKPAA